MVHIGTNNFYKFLVLFNCNTSSYYMYILYTYVSTFSDNKLSIIVLLYLSLGVIGDCKSSLLRVAQCLEHCSSCFK